MGMRFQFCEKNAVGKDHCLSVYKPISVNCSTAVLSKKDRVLIDIHQINMLNGSLQRCRLPSNSCQYEWPITSKRNFFETFMGRACVPQSLGRGHKTIFRSPFSSTMWVSRIKFRPSGLTSSTFIHWAISQALHSILCAVLVKDKY